MLSYKLLHCCKDLICVFAVPADNEMILIADSLATNLTIIIVLISSLTLKIKDQTREVTSLFLQKS